MQKMLKRGRLQTKPVITGNNRQLREQVLQTMSRKQKRAWKKLTPQEREKLLQSVEKKVNSKLGRQNTKISRSQSGAKQKMNVQPQIYRKRNMTIQGQSTGQFLNLRRKRVIQKALKKLPLSENSREYMSENIPGDRTGSRRFLRVKTMRRMPVIKGISQSDEAKIRTLIRSTENSVQSGVKQADTAHRGVISDNSEQIKQEIKHKIIEQEKARTTAIRRVQVNSATNKTAHSIGGAITDTDALHSKSARIEKAYNKQFGKELKKLSRKQTKLYRREFVFQLNNEIQKIKGKENAQKDVQREKMYDELAAKGFAGSVRAASLPISLPLKIKTEKIMMQIAAAIGSFIASIVSAVLPIIAIIAVVVSIFSFIAGFFGILAGSWDPASAGLPDVSYVTNTAVQWAEYIAQNDNHGYNDGYFSRWGPTDYSNITFVVTAFDRTGLTLKKDGAKDVEDLYDACMLNGFMDVKDEVSSSGDLKTGDILVKLGSDPRLEIYCGERKMVGAISDERGRQKHGESGDQTGKEICIETYSNKGWDYILRYYGDMTLFGGIGSELAEFALSFEGRLPYVYGGTSLVTGADCSGFVQSVFAHFGYSIPRTAGAQYAAGRKVGSNVNDWQPGDIIYYSRTGTVQDGGTGEHIVIYVGNGKVVGESNPSTGCVVYNWNYRSDYVGTARYLPDFDNSAVLIGNDNSTKIWNYLRRTLGCSRAAAAGVMGSIYAESGFDPTAIQPNGVGHGICQWSWSRWYGADGLQNFANAHHKNWSDLALQLAFFKHEAVENNSMGAYYPGGWQKYKAITSVDGEGGAAHVFFYSFEYGSYVSYGTFTSSDFEYNFACTSKRLAIARSCYQNPGTYP